MRSMMYQQKSCSDLCLQDGLLHRIFYDVAQAHELE